MRVGLFGAGRLAGAILDRLGDSVVWQVTRQSPPPDPVDVAIEASSGAAVDSHLEWALEHDVDLVIASTDWDTTGLVERVAERIGGVVAPNLSPTVALLERLCGVLGGWCGLDAQRDLFLVEQHHARKRDAPSGTAKLLARTLVQACAHKEVWVVPPPARPLRPHELSVAAIRSGAGASSHLIGIEAPGERLLVQHEARDLTAYAQGALLAARWLHGRTGVYPFSAVIRETIDPLFLENQP